MVFSSVNKWFANRQPDLQVNGFGYCRGLARHRLLLIGQFKERPLNNQSQATHDKLQRRNWVR
jgi:hypothetical protein